MLLRQLKHIVFIIFSLTHWDRSHGWLVGAELMEPLLCVDACRMQHHALFADVYLLCLKVNWEIPGYVLFADCYVCCVSVTGVFHVWLSKSGIFSIPFSRVHKCIERCSESDRISRECLYEFNKLWISGLFFCWHCKYICLPDALKSVWKPWAETLVLLPSLYSSLLSAKWKVGFKLLKWGSRTKNISRLHSVFFLLMVGKFTAE